VEDAVQSIGFLVNDVARLLRRRFNRKAEHLGLSLAQWRVLAHLSRCEGVNQVTLAEAVEIQPMTLARLIDRLAEAGLVERRADPKDRRAFRLHLAEGAEPYLKAMHELAAETRQEAMSELPEESVKTLVACLLHMKKQLSDAQCEDADLATENESSRRNVANNI